MTNLFKIVLAVSIFIITGAFIVSAVNGATSTSSRTSVVTLKDSDGDGLLDDEDPHPEVAEIYIVTDDNGNGIVDEFEDIKDNQGDHETDSDSDE